MPKVLALDFRRLADEVVRLAPQNKGRLTIPGLAGQVLRQERLHNCTEEEFRQRVSQICRELRYRGIARRRKHRSA